MTAASSWKAAREPRSSAADTETVSVLTGWNEQQEELSGEPTLVTDAGDFISLAKTMILPLLNFSIDPLHIPSS